MCKPESNEPINVTDKKDYYLKEMCCRQQCGHLFVLSLKNHNVWGISHGTPKTKLPKRKMQPKSNKLKWFLWIK